MTVSKYDYSVSVTRVCAMFFIIICHLGSYFGLVPVGQFFNVGVPIFFLISGYLYGDKKIFDTGKWIKGRLVRIYVPLLLWGIVMMGLILLRGQTLPGIKEWFFFLMNLHGLNFVFYNMPDLAPGPWFFTVIMFCYLFVALFQMIERRHKIAGRLFYYGGIIPLTIFIIGAYLGVSITLSFLVGYGLKKRKMLEKKRPYNVMVGMVIFLIAVMLRLGTKRFIDGTILYNQVIVSVSHLMLAVSVFIEIRWLFEIFQSIMIGIAKSAVFKWMDQISIYTYISHDWFIRDIFGASFPLILAFIIYFAVVAIVASALFLIGTRITRFIMCRI